ncbi:hypothetical protein [Baekduia sp. Peel2402]|uniref:hypothetical protein n=1 Tax=Baekduia sp. Peel2402 TaxID=3458296 RepID=UPI00403E9F17
MPVRRELRPLLLVAVLGVAIALAETVTGLGTGLLLLSPALVLLLPLLAGRYPGEETLERLVARRAPSGRRVRPAPSLPPRRRPRALTRRGGRLLSASLAERGPPVFTAVA